MRVFFLLMSLSFCFLYAQNFQTHDLLTQKLADTPKDKPIAVQQKGSLILCYTPDFSQKQGFVALKNCQHSLPARYDVFGRIAWQVNDTWLCLNAPDLANQKVFLAPCAINEKKQFFRVKNKIFYAQHSNLSLQDKDGFVILSENKQATHILHNMQDWLNTVARPFDLNIISFIGWSFITRESFDMYYLTDDKSVKNEPINLIFNTQSGQIAKYDKTKSKMLCLASTQTMNKAWSWVNWQSCSFVKPKENEQWQISIYADNNEALIKDYLGNVLRIRKYGTQWGVPYTASAEYLAKDTEDSPNSLFRFSNDMQDWIRFVNANFSDSLQTCPASGNESNTFVKKAHSEIKLKTLPPNFTLSQEWKNRLFQIASSTDGVAMRAGDCGVCLLHTYQILAELNEYTNSPLRDGSGYFFDTQRGVNPFYSFQTRYPLLARQLEHYSTANIPPNIPQDEMLRYAIQIYRAIALSMYAGHSFRAQEFATTEAEIRSLLRTLLDASLGSMWVLHIYSMDTQGEVSGHAVPVLRLRDGLLIIPTNSINTSYENYINYLNHSYANTVNEALNLVSMQRTQNVILLFAMQLGEFYENALTGYVSNNNCTGDGENRRGNRHYPTSQTINQCLSGRCIVQ